MFKDHIGIVVTGAISFYLYRVTGLISHDRLVKLWKHHTANTLVPEHSLIEDNDCNHKGVGGFLFS